MGLDHECTSKAGYSVGGTRCVEKVTLHHAERIELRGVDLVVHSIGGPEGTPKGGDLLKKPDAKQLLSQERLRSHNVHPDAVFPHPCNDKGMSHQETTRATPCARRVRLSAARVEDICRKMQCSKTPIAARASSETKLTDWKLA